MVISTDKAPKAIGPYSQACMTESIIYTSGQLPIDSTTGRFVEGGIKEQTRQSLRNINAILESVGSGMDKVLKTTVFLSDMNNFASMNEVYGEFFKDGQYPARSAIEVSKLPMNALIEIEAVAARH